MDPTVQHPETISYDLVVCGGGLAGVCAAIASARRGVRTAILQDRPVFGGNSSSEIRVVPYGCAMSNAWAAETGIPRELVLEDRAGNHEAFFDHGMINSHYDMVLHEAVRRERCLDRFMSTTVRFVEAEELAGNGGYERRIKALLACQLGTERHFRFEARAFIDATGDGTVGYGAGADFRYGREARSEFGENLAPIEADEVTMGSTITMRARKIDRAVEYVPPPWIETYKTAKDIGLGRELYHLGKEVFGGYWWLEVCNPFHQIRDTQEIRDELHRHVLGVWNYIKNYSPQKEQARNYVLDWIGMIPGKRESRRLMGDVVLTEADCHRDRRWPDGVAYAGWWIDLHMKGGILNKENPGEREDIDDNYKHWIRIAPFGIPLRCYYSRNVENLWMAGRTLSVSHVGLGPVRVQLSLGAQGQAVGTAAAMALEAGLAPRSAADPERPFIERIRQALLKDNVRLLGARNRDPDDLALRAQVEADSELGLDLQSGTPQLWLSLERSLGQSLPLTADHLDEVRVLARNVCDSERALELEVQEMERLWDREPGRPVARARLIVAPGFEGWLPAKLDAALNPGRPHRLVLGKAPGLEWACRETAPTGTVLQFLYECPGGCEDRNRGVPSLQEQEVSIPAYRHWWQIRRKSAFLAVTPESRPYSASNVVNGIAYPEGLPNLWKADPARALPQSIRLRWKRPVVLGEVRIAFDTDLDLSTNLIPAFWTAPELPKRWRLLSKDEGDWELLREVKGNFQHHCVVRFPPVRCRVLRLEILEANGESGAASSPGVYEIRAYAP